MIYLIKCCTGEYDDYHESIIFVFEDEKLANEKLAELKIEKTKRIEENKKYLKEHENDDDYQESDKVWERSSCLLDDEDTIYRLESYEITYE